MSYKHYKLNIYKHTWKKSPYFNRAC